MLRMRMSVAVLVVVMGAVWAFYFWSLFSPLGWRTLVAVAYEGFLVWMVSIFVRYLDGLGGWKGTEVDS